MAGFYEKLKSGIDRIKKRLIMDSKKWVFTVHLATACSFLFYCKNDIQIFPAIFSVVDQQPGMENVVSNEYIIFIDWEGKMNIIPIPAVFGIFIVFFLAGMRGKIGRKI